VSTVGHMASHSSVSTWLDTTGYTRDRVQGEPHTTHRVDVNAVMPQGRAISVCFDGAADRELGNQWGSHAVVALANAVAAGTAAQPVVRQGEGHIRDNVAVVVSFSHAGGSVTAVAVFTSDTVAAYRFSHWLPTWPQRGSGQDAAPGI